MVGITDHNEMKNRRTGFFWASAILMFISILFVYSMNIGIVVILVGMSIICTCKMIYWDLKDTILHPPKIEELKKNVR